MITTLTILTALVCLLLILVVLIQNPKGGGIDASFGAQANQMFGAARQTDFIEKVTWYLAIALFVLCILSSVLVDSSAVTNLRPQ